MERIVVTCPIVRQKNNFVIGNAKIQGSTHKELMILVGVLVETLARELMVNGGRGILKATYSLELGLSLDLSKYDPPQSARERRNMKRAAERLNGYKINNLQIKDGGAVKLTSVLIDMTFFIG